MTHINKSADLKATDSETKEIVYDEPVKEGRRQSGWFLLDDHLDDPLLTPTLAILLTILENLSSNKKGFSYPFNSFLEKKLKVKERQIQNYLQELKDKKFIYIHSYVTQKGQRREIVTRPSAGTYHAYLRKNKRYDQVKKFEKEFMDFLIDSPPPTPPDNSPPPSSNTSTSTTSPKPTITESKEQNSAPAKNCACAPAMENGTRKIVQEPDPQSSAGAYNTTYYPYRTSDVTGKEPEGTRAAFFSNLRKELENHLGKEKAAVGLKWYYLQTEEKRNSMKNPAACIVSAVNKGYAKTKLDEKEAEDYQIQKKKKAVVEELQQKKKELSLNEKYAKKVLEHLGFKEGFKYKLDRACFVISNDSLEKHRDEETGAPYFIMPSGHKHYGAKAGVRVELKDSPAQFKSTIDGFVRHNWDVENHKKKMRL